MANLMRKSISVDSSLGVITQAAKRGSTGLRTTSTAALTEKRARSPLSKDSSAAAAASQPSPPPAPHAPALARAAVYTAVLAAVIAAALLPSPVRDAWLSERNFMPTNATENAAGCLDIETLGSFSLDRFMGDWHHVAWLHSHGKSPAFERKVGQQCTTAQFGGAKRRSPLGKFSVKYVTRPLVTGHVSSGREDIIAFVEGAGRTPNVSEAAKMQVQLDTGHVLPLWLVSTDYDSWALACTTSMSLGEGHPVQVMTLLSRTWAVDQLDVGDRLNDLAGLRLQWRDVSFADLQSCGALFDGD